MPPARLARCHAVVIGVGAVGRQVALQLASTGVPALTLYDPDDVGVENLAVQGFWETDVGDPKVQAVANVCRQQYPRMELQAKQERFRRSAVRSWVAGKDHVVFCCVDTIAARKLVWEAVKSLAGFYVDGRMTAEIVRVLASGQPADDRELCQDFLRDRGGLSGKLHVEIDRVCGERSCGTHGRTVRSLVAGGVHVVGDQTLNLLAAELSVADSAG